MEDPTFRGNKIFWEPETSKKTLRQKMFKTNYPANIVNFKVG